MKGGNRNSGPAPDPNALRRDRDESDWVLLPASGRVGRAPKWPLLAATAHVGALQAEAGDDEALLEVVGAVAEKYHARELELWAREWKRPQAVMWERNGQEVEVALYVRALAAAEFGSAPVTLRTLVRQHQEALGISLPGLARNRWRIESRLVAVEGATPGAPARAGLKVVAGGAG